MCVQFCPGLLRTVFLRPLAHGKEKLCLTLGQQRFTYQFLELKFPFSYSFSAFYFPSH